MRTFVSALFTLCARAVADCFHVDEAHMMEKLVQEPEVVVEAPAVPAATAGQCVCVCVRACVCVC